MAAKRAGGDVLAAALEYAALGWRVFPILAVGLNGCECGPDCDRPGKHPALKGWPTEATTNADVIRAWFNEHPARGCGIATGAASGLTILDIDGDEGVEELSKLAGNEGMPPTPCVQSRPGRFHYYFQYDSRVNTGAGKLGKSLDTRSDGGYVVAPPSRHETGGAYTWIQHPSKAELAPWPEFLLSKPKAAGKRGRPAKETFNPANPMEESKLKDALEHLDADDEERWAQVGWILGRAYHQSDKGFALYSAWSARSKKYNAKRTRGHYYERSREVRGSEIKTIASIYAWAGEEGWTGALNPEEQETRDLHVFENPFREATMVAEFTVVAAASPVVFLSGARLVRVVRYGTSGIEDYEIRRDPMTYVMMDHDADTLAVAFGNIAAYWSLGAQGPYRSEFRRKSIGTFLACREFAGCKPLLAFVPHPTLRADGTLLSEVGYDAASCLYLTTKVEGLVVNRALKAKDAAAAMKRVMEPFSEYPWATERDRTVFVAALLTVGLRHWFDIVPLFAFSSPKHGSGKTQLAECISRIWFGTTLSKATWTPNPEEMEKRIAAFLLAGDRMVCLDNVTEGMRLEDSTLNKVLTSRRNTFRILGKTERVELTNEATWFATGNQLQLSGDISRRALLCYLDARVIDPGARVFKIENLPAHVSGRRSALMSDLLSVIASWVDAGRPASGGKAPRGFGSFSSWYSVIRPMLLWAGEGDISEALDAAQDEDTEQEALNAWANALRRALPADGERRPLMTILGYFTASAELRSTFTGCVAPGREPNARTLSEILRRTENKIFISDNPGEKFTLIRKQDGHTKNPTWGIEHREE